MAKCVQCGIESAKVIPGYNDFCPDCGTSILESFRNRERSEEAAMRAREKRVARQEAERERWRAKRRQERAHEEEQALARRAAYRDEIVADEWRAFSNKNAQLDPFAFSRASRDFERWLASRYEWLR